MITKLDQFLIPDWPAPPQVRAAISTKHCGNTAVENGEDPQQLTADRQKLYADLQLPQPPRWLKQVHGNIAVNLDTDRSEILTADASYSHSPTTVCVVNTADCLPILICNQQGTEIAAIHAGWKGLLAGIIDSAIGHFKAPRSQLLVWLGPGIGPDHFEVNQDIQQAYQNRHADYGQGFFTRQESLFADLYQLAKINLQHCGVTAVFGGDFCTYCDNQRFYSYRRDHGQTGRMASLIWLAG